MVAISCGIDWSERSHDVALADAPGRIIRRRPTGCGSPTLPNGRAGGGTVTPSRRRATTDDITDPKVLT